MRNLLLIILMILFCVSVILLKASIHLEQWEYVAQGVFNMVVSAGLAWVVYKDD